MKGEGGMDVKVWWDCWSAKISNKRGNNLNYTLENGTNIFKIGRVNVESE